MPAQKQQGAVRQTNYLQLLRVNNVIESDQQGDILAVHSSKNMSEGSSISPGRVEFGVIDPPGAGDWCIQDLLGHQVGAG